MSRSLQELAGSGTGARLGDEACRNLATQRWADPKAGWRWANQDEEWRLVCGRPSRRDTDWKLGSVGRNLETNGANKLGAQWLGSRDVAASVKAIQEMNILTKAYEVLLLRPFVLSLKCIIQRRICWVHIHSSIQSRIQWETFGPRHRHHWVLFNKYKAESCWVRQRCNNTMDRAKSRNSQIK